MDGGGYFEGMCMVNIESRLFCVERSRLHSFLGWERRATTKDTEQTEKEGKRHDAVSMPIGINVVECLCGSTFCDAYRDRCFPMPVGIDVRKLARIDVSMPVPIDVTVNQSFFFARKTTETPTYCLLEKLRFSFDERSFILELHSRQAQIIYASLSRESFSRMKISKRTNRQT